MFTVVKAAGSGARICTQAFLIKYFRFLTPTLKGCGGNERKEKRRKIKEKKKQEEAAMG